MDIPSSPAATELAFPRPRKTESAQHLGHIDKPTSEPSGVMGDMAGGKIGKYPLKPEGVAHCRRWARFVHHYYFFNAAMVLSYGVLRLYISSPRLATKETWTGLSRELEVITLATVALLSKYRKMATFDEFLERLFFHGKAAVTILLFLVGLGHMVSYLIAWIEVTRLSPGEFQSMVRSPPQAPSQRVAWLVMFHADWCGASLNLQPMFGVLARRYADKNRRFACVDVVAHPEIAEDLNISTAGTSKQLPTLALFASGREVCRLPTFASDGRVVRARMDEVGVTKYFELDKEFKATTYSRRGRGKN